MKGLNWATLWIVIAIVSVVTVAVTILVPAVLENVPLHTVVPGLCARNFEAPFTIGIDKVAILNIFEFEAFFAFNSATFTFGNKILVFVGIFIAFEFWREVVFMNPIELETECKLAE